MAYAARQGDLTAHGGTIAMGDPAVLIGGLPAARQGDLHVCPLASGTVPHVGGPVAMGATTVLISGSPAARMGDLCVCCGPPDAVAMGEPTVQINSGGPGLTMIGGGGGQTMIGGTGMTLIGGGEASGGASGSGAAGSGAQAATQTAAATEGLVPEETTLHDHFLAARLVDGGGRPLAAHHRHLVDADGTEDGVALPGHGQARRAQMAADGDSTVRPQALFGARWSAQEIAAGDEVTLTATAVGFEDGMPAHVVVHACPVHGGRHAVAAAETTVADAQVEVSFTLPPEGKGGDEGGDHVASSRYAAAVTVAGYPQATRSPVVSVVKDVTVGLETIDGAPVANARYTAHLATGEQRAGRLDDEGRAVLERVPADHLDVVYPEYRVTQRLRSGARSVPPQGTQHPASTHPMAATEDEAICTVDAVHLRCGHDVEALARSVELSAATQPFQVVPSPRATGVETVEIVYCGPTDDDRGRLRATGTGLAPLRGDDAPSETWLVPTSREAGAGRYAMKCVVPAPGVAPWAFWKRAYWSSLREPASVQVDGIPGKAIEIEVYPGDQYTLQVTFPPLRALKVGQKLETVGQTVFQKNRVGIAFDRTHTETAEVKGWAPLRGTRTARAAVRGKSIGSVGAAHTQRRGRVQARSTRPAGALDVVDVLTLKKNGRTITVNPARATESLLTLAASVYDMIQAVRALPKFGWYCDFDVQILQGALAFEWGWAEHTDHRAFLQMAAHVDVDLLDAHIEIGLGVDGFGFALQVFAQIRGKLHLQLAGRRVSPDGADEAALTFKPTLEGLVGARAKLGHLVEVTATVVTGIEISGGTLRFNPEQGASMEASLAWTGLQAVVKGGARVKMRGQKKASSSTDAEQRSVLIERRELAHWRWPEETTYEASYITRDEVQHIVETTFRADLLPVEEQIDWWVDHRVEVQDVARRVADRIHERPDLMRDAKSIEGLAIRVKNELNVLGGLHETADRLHRQRSIRYPKLRAFADGPALQRVFDDHRNAFREAQERARAVVEQQMVTSTDPHRPYE
jgi:uncharacterized Zn-binding protein involved in type VI secretion